MERYAVVGASSGTGLALTRYLAEQGAAVLAISRHPSEASGSVRAATADVTDAASLAAVLNRDFDAIFYTVDVHGLIRSRAAVRAAMYDGLANLIAAVRGRATPPRIVLLSVIGTDRRSWVCILLGALKRGMRRNIIDQEAMLSASGLPFVICRAPRLRDGPGGGRLAATLPRHRLNMRMSIDRIDLAVALARAARHAPVASTWDVFADDTAPAPDWLSE